MVAGKGGVGKTVFVESLAATMSHAYEIVVFDCFGGGAYRSPNQARHLPSVGFVQLTNELASTAIAIFSPVASSKARMIDIVMPTKQALGKQDPGRAYVVVH